MQACCRGFPLRSLVGRRSLSISAAADGELNSLSRHHLELVSVASDIGETMICLLDGFRWKMRNTEQD